MTILHCSKCGREIIDDKKTQKTRSRPTGRFKVGVNGVKAMCPKCFRGDKPSTKY